MKRYLLGKLVTGFERFLGVELPYMRTIVDHAPGALLPIGLGMPASAYGGSVPTDILHTVRLGAAQAQDCGECLQITVNMALRDGMEPAVVRAVLEGDAEGWDTLHAEAFDFGSHIGTGLDPVDAREAFETAFGPRGVIEASMAAASALFFPGLKRGMGMARSCDLGALEIGGSRAPSPASV